MLHANRQVLIKGLILKFSTLDPAIVILVNVILINRAAIKSTLIPQKLSHVKFKIKAQVQGAWNALRLTSLFKLHNKAKK